MSKNCQFDQLWKASLMASYTVASGTRCSSAFKLNTLLEFVAMDITDGCGVCSVETSSDLLDSKHFFYEKISYKRSSTPKLRQRQHAR